MHPPDTRRPRGAAVDFRRERDVSLRRLQVPWRLVGSAVLYLSVLLVATAWGERRNERRRPRRPGELLAETYRPPTAGLLARPVARVPALVRVPPIVRVPRMPWEPRVAAIAQVLRRRTGGDSAVAERTARAIVREADRAKLSPSLLVGVVLVENTTLTPNARNQRTGATGLMQVMPMHAGHLGCGSRDLTNVESNICHGSRLLSWLLHERGGDTELALLAYNGCVGERRTPDCRRYAGQVFDHMERVAGEIRELQRSFSLKYLPQAIERGVAGGDVAAGTP